MSIQKTGAEVIDYACMQLPLKMVAEANKKPSQEALRVIDEACMQTPLRLRSQLDADTMAKQGTESQTPKAGIRNRAITKIEGFQSEITKRWVSAYVQKREKLLANFSPEGLEKFKAHEMTYASRKNAASEQLQEINEHFNALIKKVKAESNDFLETFKVVDELEKERYDSVSAVVNHLYDDVELKASLSERDVKTLDKLNKNRLGSFNASPLNSTISYSLEILKSILK